MINTTNVKGNKMQALSFEGKGLEYFKIWIVNILLTIITLGLYYPWAKVRNNRYLYANSTLDGRNFEYHATGKQLFIGYVISTILVLLYFGLQSALPSAALVVLLVLFVAFPWLIWRSLKFNMRVTSFSNVLFSFDGELKGSYINFIALPAAALAVVLAGFFAVTWFASTLNGASPVLGSIIGVIGFSVIMALAVYAFSYIKTKNVSYVINGTKYGQGQFEIKLDVAPFVKIWLTTIGIYFLAVIVFMFAIGIAAFVVGSSSQLLDLASLQDDPEALASAMIDPVILLTMAVVYIGFIVISILTFSYSYVRQREYIYSKIMLDQKIAFASNLTVTRFALVAISNLFLFIFTFGLAFPWMTVRMAKLVLSHTMVDTSVGLDNYVTQQQESQSSLGEQIGDAFNINVDIGL